MVDDIFGNDRKEFYIAKFYSSLPYYWGAIFAVYLSATGSKYIVERYIVWNKNINRRSGGIKYPPISAFLLGPESNKINLAEDINIIIQVMSSRFYLKNKKYFFRDMSISKYTCIELEKDLKHLFMYDIARYSKFFEHGFKKIANKTKCQKLKEDIFKCNS